MSHQLSHDGVTVDFSDQEYDRLNKLKFKVSVVRERWYLGVPSVLIEIANDMSSIPPSMEIIDAGIEFDK